MILNIMHHVHDCNRVLEVRRGLVVSIVLFSPTNLKDRVIKALELCSCGKEKKKIVTIELTWIEINFDFALFLQFAEAMQDPSVAARLADTKASGEVRALEAFYAMLQNEPDRAFYGWVKQCDL